MTLPLFSGTFTFFVFIIIGHAIFIIGSITGYYYAVCFGVLLGNDSQSLHSACMSSISKYLKQQELFSFILGCLLSFSQIGSLMHDYLSYYIYQQPGYVLGLLFLFLLITLGFFLLRRYNKNLQLQIYKNTENNGIGSNGDGMKKFDAYYWMLVMIFRSIYGKPYLVAVLFTLLLFGVLWSKIGGTSYISSLLILLATHFVFSYFKVMDYQYLAIMGIINILHRKIPTVDWNAILDDL